MGSGQKIANKTIPVGMNVNFIVPFFFVYVKEEFQGVIIIFKSKDRQYNGQKKNNKQRSTNIPIKIMIE